VERYLPAEDAMQTGTSSECPLKKDLALFEPMQPTEVS